jgi:hypothetical protein
MKPGDGFAAARPHSPPFVRLEQRRWAKPCRARFAAASVASMGELRFGPARIPSRESPEEAIALLQERGYTACEIDFEGKFWMDYPWAARLGELARGAGIVLSVHAPIAGFMGHVERDKNLEEPPPYAVIVLVADDVGPLSETIRSRCQPVPFRRLSERAVRAAIEERAPGLSENQAAALARVASGRLDRVERLLDPAAAERRTRLLETARSVYRDPAFVPGEAARVVVDGAGERAKEARAKAEEELETLDLPDREAEQRVRRAARGAEREELLLALDELAAWYRDLVAVSAGAERAAIHVDRLAELREDATEDRAAAAEEAAELCRGLWRELEELQLQAPLAFEALFVKLRRAFAGALVAA